MENDSEVELRRTKRAQLGGFRWVADVFAITTGLLFVIGYYTARTYYSQFGLAPSDLGLSQVDYITAALGPAAALTIIVAFFMADMVLLRRMWRLGILGLKRPSRRRAAGVQGVTPLGRYVGDLRVVFREMRGTMFSRFLLLAFANLTALVSLMLLSVYHQQNVLDTAWQTRSGQARVPRVADLPLPRSVAFAAAPEHCMMLLGTSEGVWFLWNVDRQVLERHAVGEGILETCDNT